MCGVEYLKMGISHRFAKAVVGTDWLLRRTEAYQKFDGRFGSIGSMLWMVRCCGWLDADDEVVRPWFVELLSGGIKKAGRRSIGKEGRWSRENWNRVKFCYFWNTLQKLLFLQYFLECSPEKCIFAVGFEKEHR